MNGLSQTGRSRRAKEGAWTQVIFRVAVIRNPVIFAEAISRVAPLGARGARALTLLNEFGALIVP